MRNVILDCDNTIGVPGRDIDDALALFYLLGRPEVRLLGVTTSFGNSDQATVYEYTRKMFSTLGLERLPLVRGAESAQRRESEAAKFIWQTATANAPVSLLVTGSVTNVWEAFRSSPDLAQAVDQVVCMGGLWEPLLVNGREIQELNFSVDPEAVAGLLGIPVAKAIITGNVCSDAYFGPELIRRTEELAASEARPDLIAFMASGMRKWSDHLAESSGASGFIIWDAVAAAFLTSPDLFDIGSYCVDSTPGELARGRLRTAPSEGARHPVQLPLRIRSLESLLDGLFDAWKKASA